MARLPDGRQLNVRWTISNSGVSIELRGKDTDPLSVDPSANIQFYPRLRSEERLVHVDDRDALLADYKAKIDASQGLPARLKTRAIQALDVLAEKNRQQTQTDRR